MQIGKWEITKKDLLWFICCLILALCFFVGLFVYAKDCATAILSGASTAISIVLSIVAILYTMIEGANSSKINQEAIEKLNQLDIRLEQISEKTIKMSELKGALNELIPQVNTVVKGIEDNSGRNLNMFDEKTRKSIEYLRNYFNEDIDE